MKTIYANQEDWFPTVNQTENKIIFSPKQQTLRPIVKWMAYSREWKEAEIAKTVCFFGWVLGGYSLNTSDKPIC